MEVTLELQHQQPQEKISHDKRAKVAMYLLHLSSGEVSKEIDFFNDGKPAVANNRGAETNIITTKLVMVTLFPMPK